eukprot:COSAG01_NODE_22017_length_875_cov_235.858247_1_plen_33_part_10
MEARGATPHVGTRSGGAPEPDGDALGDAAPPAQ